MPPEIVARTAIALRGGRDARPPVGPEEHRVAPPPPVRRRHERAAPVVRPTTRATAAAPIPG